jgi:phenylacetate-CoA ligase
MLDHFKQLRALHQVMRDARLERPELHKLIFNRLKKVLVSAYLHVPYYRRIMQNSGYNPIKNYSGPNDLLYLPITSKENIKKEGLKAFIKEGTDLNRYYSVSTSGSTGIPLRAYMTSYGRSIKNANYTRLLFMNGASIRHKQMAIRRPDRCQKRKSIYQRFGIFRSFTINYLEHSTEEIVDAFFAYKPDILLGNRSHLDLMALEMYRRGIKANGLKILMTGAEVLHDHNRKLFREQFGVDVVENYGSMELGALAYETQEHNGLHLSEDLYFYEFLDENEDPVSPGEFGRVVVTDLTNTLMPFIRYDQGDLVIFEYTSNLNGYPERRLTKIIGRDDDYTMLPDGKRVHAQSLYKVVARHEDIIQFRIIQKNLDLFEILIVADNSYFASIRDDILKEFQQKFPPTINFDIAQVDIIDTDPSGKLRAVVSELNK